MATRRQNGRNKGVKSYAVAGSVDRLGIGAIIMSTLDQARFQAQHGGAVDGWVLCNGDSYPTSQWAHVSGDSHVPNLVGRYPRGYWPGHTPGPGGYQDDAVANHTHLLEGGRDSNRWGVMNDAQGGGDNAVPRWGYAGQFHTTGVVGVDANETRPKTTIINFYIRIN